MTTTKTKHTPAPWTVAWQAANGKYDSNGNYWIRQSVGIKASEAEANARLIAAAPELLSSLKECENMIRAFLSDNISASEIHKRVKSAISKAEGTL